MTLHVAIAILSALASITVVVTFFGTRRAAAVADGKRQEQFDQVRRELDRAMEKIHILETRMSDGDLSVAEIKTDIKHVLFALARLEKKIDAMHEEEE